MNRNQLVQELRQLAYHLTAAADALSGTTSKKKPVKRFLSKDARRRIAEAQKLRWKKAHAAKKAGKNVVQFAGKKAA